MSKNKKELGTFINYNNSNWFTREKRFRRYHLKGVAGVFLPNLFGLVFLSLSFKYASIGGLNQGILPTFNSLAGVFCGILFYFKFNEIISVAQFIGMIVMISSVVLFGFEGANSKTSIPIPTSDR